MVLQENVAVGIVPSYFEKYYNIAVNVYCFGTALGIIIAPLIAQMLLDIYGWRGTILMLCGLHLHSVPFGALLYHNHQTGQTIERSPLLSSDNNSLNGNESLPILPKMTDAIMKSLSIDLITAPPFIARVLVPSIIYGYTLAAWAIYIVSFALSNGATMEQSAFVATSGGIGIAVIKPSLPALNTKFSYRRLMYTSSFTATSLALSNIFGSVAGLSIISFIFGLGFGMLGTETYIAAKDVAKEDQYVSAVAWCHLVYGFAMIAGATLTGISID